MAVLGETWTVVVLREIFNGVRRFADMREHTGIPRQVLTNRLASLVEYGVLRREPYQEPGARVRHEYRLTAKGLDLYPVLTAVKEWGDRYLADPGARRWRWPTGTAAPRSTPSCTARTATTSTTIVRWCPAPVPVPSAAPDVTAAAPLRNKVFRGLWLGVLASNVGTWMQTVGAQWHLVHEPDAAT